MAFLDFMQSHGSQTPLVVEPATEPSLISSEAPSLEAHDSSETEPNTDQRKEGSLVTEQRVIKSSELRDADHVLRCTPSAIYCFIGIL